MTEKMLMLVGYNMKKMLLTSLNQIYYNDILIFTLLITILN
jgi:hypothetical protein